MDMANAIALLDKTAINPSSGLPEELFLLVSRLTPLINVDLLIKNELGQTLLTWRDDGFYPPSWHVPGGIIRYKETFDKRIKETAKNELGAEVVYEPKPLAINEVIIEKRKNRGHFISILYACRLITPLNDESKCQNKAPRKNEWQWHSACPENIISVHKMYKEYINGTKY